MKDNKTEEPACYLIIKRGLYYRPNSSGYTGIKDEAGRYSLSETAVIFPAVSDSGLSFIHENNAPEYTEACYYDLKLKHQLLKKTELVDIYASALADIESKTGRRSSANHIARQALSLGKLA